MSARIQNHITGRLSLRPPQAESLAKLKQALDAAPEMLTQERDIPAVLATLKAQFPTPEDFEREFPSLCFALATGVGKTRLMGAFIAYLHLAHSINNFFVLAPNLTIYNKLIADFTPNTPKYVFKGIGEFAITAPRVITGDNYDQQNILGGELLGEVRINIFNISKITSEVRGGREPRIKRMKEVLGDSYFNHLANLPDLVLLMDESHRYRAQAGMRAINELKPLFGLEVTATPFVESSRGPVPFKNVVMDYPLARAMEDGFVKEPAVVTQRNFDAKAHAPEEIEKTKLEDGVRLHETTKVELLTYARENGVKPVKPFMLVIARDTTHAGQLRELIEERLYEGRYKGKVIQVDSSRTGAEEEEMISRLLAVESVDEPTEIVIHVNMLKEGWDVLHHRAATRRQCAHADRAIHRAGSAPALRQAHRRGGGGSAEHRRARQVSGDHRRSQPERFADPVEATHTRCALRGRPEGERASRIGCDDASGIDRYTRDRSSINRDGQWIIASRPQTCAGLYDRCRETGGACGDGGDRQVRGQARFVAHQPRIART